MKLALILGLTALVVLQVAAVPAAEPDAFAVAAKKAAKHKKHKHRKHKHKHHKHKHHGNTLTFPGSVHAPVNGHDLLQFHPLGENFCGLPGMFCAEGKRKRDLDSLEGSEEGYCGAPGNPCYQVKRTAWAIADALEGARNAPESETFDGAPDTPGANAEAIVDEIAHKARGIYGNVYGREANASAAAEADSGLERRDASEDSEIDAYESGDLGICGTDDTPCLAVRDANPKRAKGANFCGLPGTFCFNKREAEPKRAHGANFCGLPGTFCFNKRDADAAAQPKRAHGANFCGLPGTFCFNKREALPEAEAEAEPKHAHGANFCGLPGTFCFNKRDASPEAEAEPKRAHGANFCGLPGTFCFNKRNAAPQPEAEPKRAHGANFCGLPGTFCFNKRDAAAEAEAEPKRAHGANFCGLPGTFCFNKRQEQQAERRDQGAEYCGFPGVPCLPERDAKDLVSILAKSDPQWLKDECRKEGHACNTIYKIRDALHGVKNEARYIQDHVQDPLDKFVYCSDNGQGKCNDLTWVHQYAAKHNPQGAAQAEKRCAANDGLCSAAKRDLDELESTIDEAVAVIERDN